MDNSDVRVIWFFTDEGDLASRPIPALMLTIHIADDKNVSGENLNREAEGFLVVLQGSCFTKKSVFEGHLPLRGHLGQKGQLLNSWLKANGAYSVVC